MAKSLKISGCVPGTTRDLLARNLILTALEIIKLEHMLTDKRAQFNREVDTMIALDVAGATETA